LEEGPGYSPREPNLEEIKNLKELRSIASEGWATTTRAIFGTQLGSTSPSERCKLRHQAAIGVARSRVPAPPGKSQFTAENIVNLIDMRGPRPGREGSAATILTGHGILVVREVGEGSSGNATDLTA
jgi:hypothetical protein